MLDRETTDAAVVAELGRRIAVHRVARNLTQGQFADEAGVGRSTVQRVERGESIQLASFVKLLRALDRLDALDALLSPDLRSPLAELDRQRGRRQRVRGTRSQAESADGPAEPWSWGDDETGR